MKIHSNDFSRPLVSYTEGYQAKNANVKSSNFGVICIGRSWKYDTRNTTRLSLLTQSLIVIATDVTLYLLTVLDTLKVIQCITLVPFFPKYLWAVFDF